ncbi:MAG: HAMP domain-containing histidine kinase [Epsilonproteobacteria bacterium]|nr:HAMP domain-containing histidine kinase [Campylobacterota bacterium]
MQTRMFPGERKSLRRFWAIYLSTTLLLIGAGSLIFYRYAYHKIIERQNQELRHDAEKIIPKLKALHRSLAPTLPYPVIPGLESALYDIDGNYLIGQIRPVNPRFEREFWLRNDMLFCRLRVEPYYLGTAYAVVSRPLDTAPVEALKGKLAAAFAAAVLFMGAVAFWLGRLFLAPVRQTVRLLDDFIKDSTHELNTPISTILANVELFKSLHPEHERDEALGRIESASRRLSRIYDDLAYLRLNHRRHRRVESIDFSAFIEERVRDFEPIASRKGLRLESRIVASWKIEMDREDAARLVDNLLSNAVKYTRPGGEVTVTLAKGELRVKDNGDGMDEATLRRVTQRYFRGQESEGGFGLGLSIVAEIVRDYGLRWEITSRPKEGTEVRIGW